MSTSTLSAFVLPDGSPVALFATLLMDGTFRRPDGTILDLDPEGALYFPRAYVAEIGKFDPAFTQTGTVLPAADLLRSARLLGRHRGKSAHDLASIMAHPVYGARVPDIETVIAAYAEG